MQWLKMEIGHKMYYLFQIVKFFLYFSDIRIFIDFIFFIDIYIFDQKLNRLKLIKQYNYKF